MLVEAKLATLGLSLPDLDQHYRGNASGARFISHLAVGNMLYLSGTTPVKDGRPDESCAIWNGSGICARDAFVAGADISVQGRGATRPMKRVRRISAADSAARSASRCSR